MPVRRGSADALDHPGECAEHTVSARATTLKEKEHAMRASQQARISELIPEATELTSPTLDQNSAVSRSISGAAPARTCAISPVISGYSLAK